MRVPIVPLIPPTAVSERLFARPVPPPVAAQPAARPTPPRRVDVSGRPNPLLAMVQRLLPPDMLEVDGWTIAHGDGTRLDRTVPSKLRNLLNVGSMEALLDGLNGTGLVLSGIRSLPLVNERVQIVLRATRDPDNHGYRFLEQIETISVSRYWFRLNTQSISQTRTESQSLGTGATTTDIPRDDGRLANGSGTVGVTTKGSVSQGQSLSRTDAPATRSSTPGAPTAMSARSTSRPR